MGDSMFTCWGVQTLSTDERRYNPMGYHLGTVWPHDNALIAAGFRRYGMSTLPHMHLNSTYMHKLVTLSGGLRSSGSKAFVFISPWQCGHFGSCS
jgi:glycogen debranching enzyme